MSALIINQATSLNQNDNFMSELTCSIAGQIFLDPVMTTDGFTYERSMIEKWFENHNTSPKTGKVLKSLKLIPNFAVKCLIDTLNLKTKLSSNIFIKPFVLTEIPSDITIDNMVKLVDKHGVGYVDPNGDVLAEYVLKNFKSTELVSHIITVCIQNNILENNYVITDKNAKKTYKLIHFVCKYCRSTNVKQIINSGANLEAKTKPNYWKPIHFLCKYGSTNTINYLLSKNIDSDCETNNGLVPSQIARKHNKILNF